MLIEYIVSRCSVAVALLLLMMVVDDVVLGFLEHFRDHPPLASEARVVCLGEEAEMAVGCHSTGLREELLYSLRNALKRLPVTSQDYSEPLDS